MTNSLYVPEKPRLSLVQKIISHGGLTLTIVMFGVMIIASFTLGKFGDSFFQKGTIFITCAIAGIQIVIFWILLKKDPIHKKNFNFNLHTGSEGIPKPFAPLSPDQKRVLTSLYSFSYSMYNNFWYLIPVFFLFDIFIIYHSIRNEINIMSFMVISITVLFQGALIHYGRRHYLYYLDLINPVFHVSGESSILKSDRKTNHVTVNGVTFPINHYQDTNTIHQSNQLKNGEILEIFYSPYSKYIWEIKKKNAEIS